MRNITPSESGFRGSNGSIVQDERSVIYVGNAHGLLEYDGSTWRLIKMNGAPSLARNNRGKIFVGGFNQLSYLAPDQKGRISLKPVLENVNLNFGQINTLFAENEKLLFCTSTDLYIADVTLQKICSNASHINIFKLKNRFLIDLPDSGIMGFDFKRLSRLPESRAFRGVEVKGIVPVANGYLAFTSNEVLRVENGSVSKVHGDISTLFKKDNYLCYAPLSNGTIAIGTRKNGIIIIDQQCSVVSTITRSGGLYDDQVNSLFVDDANTLWATFSNGLARIETPSPYAYLNQSHGIKGKVNDIIRYQGDLLVATSDGVYKSCGVSGGQLSSDKQHVFSVYKNITSECYSLSVAKGELFASTTDGLISISKTPRTILEGETQTVQASHFDKDLMYVANGNALLCIKQEKGSWKVCGGLRGFKSSITTIAESGDKCVWIGTHNEGLYKVVSKDASLANAEIVQYKSTHGLPGNSDWIDAYNTAKGTVFSTQTGLYRYDESKDKFLPDKLIGISEQGNNTRVNPLVEDKDHNLWLSFEKENSSQKPVAVAWNLINVDHYTYITQPFNRLRDFDCNAIFPDTNLVVWFGGFNGLVSLDFKKLKMSNNTANTLIRRITLNGDSVLFYNAEFNPSFRTEYLPISFRNRTVRFEFATPVFEKNNEILHQVKLEGFDQAWSDFKQMNSKEYTNLPPGNYTFKVRAKNLFENVSREAEFKFRIKRPFYATYFAFAAYVILFVFLVYILMRIRSLQYIKEKTRLEKIIAERTEEVLAEKEKTERLLANILPERTVKELKDKGRATNMRFKMVTVLFSDIQGFTKIAEMMNPDSLVDELDRFFLQFDTIVDRYNIEKIKTIGDAYMCAGGIPDKNRTNPIEVVLAALEMQYFISEMQRKANEEGKTYWGLRIGIHTGPVVAGVIGSKKFTYDIWGDTVNIASRMESSGEVNKVNISEDTYLLINEYFDCEYRGRMPIKYKGEIDMYFVKGLKARLCEDELRLKPNVSMRNKLALLRFDDIEEHILDRLEAELTKKLYYHNVKHTIDVVVHIELLGIDEKVSEEELLLLKTAALFHDSGFLIGYNDHEMLSIQVANEVLPQYNYTPGQIKIIDELIYATRMPHNPKNKLEQIMCDADLDYLGRPDYLPVSQNLYRELLEMNFIKDSEYDWNKLQLKFLQNHRYFTDSAKRRRNQNKNKQLEKILEQDYKFGMENPNMGNA